MNADMIEHIVLLRFKRTATDAAKRELVSRLEAVISRIEGILRLEVHQDILRLEDSFDMGLFVTFADRASLQHYGDNEDRQAVSAYARSLCEQVVLFDYQWWTGCQNVAMGNSPVN